MIYHQHIETQLGEIWILNSEENGLAKSETESRQCFEARVLKEFIQSSIGNVNLDHESNGAPFIQNRPDLNISISHSDNWFTIYVSSKSQVGIDIEVPTSNIQKTEKHFLTQSEIERFQPSESVLQLCWGIKEAIYKLVKGDIQLLKNDIEIISIRKNQAVAKVKNQEIQLQRLQSDMFTLVYTN